MTVRVVTAPQAAARDAAAIGAGVPSRRLMQTAGEAAAAVIMRRLSDRLPRGALVFTGPGNNGGDGWVVARVLASHGVRVAVREVVESRTDDARAERETALDTVSRDESSGGEGIVIDALLGTGSRGAPKGEIGAAVDQINALSAGGSAVVALDVPTGLDASTGEATRAVRADLTITFGTIKRGHVVARARCGAIVVVDIGLGSWAELEDGAPHLIDAGWVAERVPAIPAEAHKGVRRRIAIAGGAQGMAGATILAARAAMRSGVGMVRLVVSTPSLAPVQAAAVEATATTWPMSDAMITSEIGDYADAVLIGPGLGHGADGKDFLERLLAVYEGPVVLDADALNAFAGDVPRLARLLRGRPGIITPHVAEFARLVDATIDEVLAQRFDIGRELARALNAVVLLKGVPTVITAPDGTSVVSASGTPVLAAAGSGDVLGGIVTTLLAQSEDPLASAACGAWMHGRAAEIANQGRPIRGVTLADVLNALGSAWAFDTRGPEPPVLAELPAVGEGEGRIR
ncbi:MAG TPA: NAD(P)H-hydrate dehydratase [Gemmatimonadaceae bacterium]